MAESFDRDWWVVSTSIAGGMLMLECRRTGATGFVPTPSPDEWHRAYGAPSAPYRWEGGDARVIETRLTVAPGVADGATMTIGTAEDEAEFRDLDLPDAGPLKTS